MTIPYLPAVLKSNQATLGHSRVPSLAKSPLPPFVKGGDLSPQIMYTNLVWSDLEQLTPIDAFHPESIPKSSRTCKPLQQVQTLVASHVRLPIV